MAAAIALPKPAGASSPCTSETRCTITRSTFSSIMRLPESNALCRSLTARTTRLDSRGAVSRCQQWQKRLQERQVWRKARRVRGRSARTPHRRHRCLRYSLHRLRKIPVPRFFFPIYERSSLKNLLLNFIYK